MENKTILILSSERWGKMMLSKHHYAVELVRGGNTVYFLNPPTDAKGFKSTFSYTSDETTKGVIVVDHSLYFPYKLKFHFKSLYLGLMKRHTALLLKSIPLPIDIVWSFDLQGFYSLRHFPKRVFKIFFPADEPIIPHTINASRGADVLISITKEIIRKFDKFKDSGFLVNHGLAKEFITVQTKEYQMGVPLRVGISGNFLRHDLDRETLLKIVRENPEIIFECWGSYSLAHSNIGGSSAKETEHFVDDLRSIGNVVMHGIVDTQSLVKGFNRMDAFLICYDIEKDHSKGTNYHKIMEYLSTGKVIVSNNVTAYKDRSGLLEMTEERDSNRMLPTLFKKVISSLDLYNSEAARTERMRFAADNSYHSQIKKIESFLRNAVNRSKENIGH